MALAHKESLAVCIQLCELKELPEKTPADIITGLTLCSVELLTTLFTHKLQQMKALSFKGNMHLSQSEIIAKVRVLIAQAAQYYNSLNMGDYWHLL